jgi:hypothetical protein
VSPGYKEYKTERVYMARMGDWRDNKDIEIPLDGVGGVSIVVKADVHREGSSPAPQFMSHDAKLTYQSQALISPLTLSRTKPRQKALPKWPDVQARQCTACRPTLYGTETPTRSPATLDVAIMGESAFLVAEPDFCTFISNRPHLLLACFCLYIDCYWRKKSFTGYLQLENCSKSSAVSDQMGRLFVGRGRLGVSVVCLFGRGVSGSTVPETVA